MINSSYEFPVLTLTLLISKRPIILPLISATDVMRKLGENCTAAGLFCYSLMQHANIVQKQKRQQKSELKLDIYPKSKI